MDGLSILVGTSATCQLLKGKIHIGCADICLYMCNVKKIPVLRLQLTSETNTGLRCR